MTPTRAIINYLEWGPKTQSDRYWLERDMAEALQETLGQKWTYDDQAGKWKRDESSSVNQ